ncbi:hypothetical protein SCL_1583 [Sulfuricaulis limicola]|uniref:PEP-CTERM protein-sorting domain-containing protein n=1 Tax=Sulfuricaulis limicola TaxID=1620215 RepID=A0A1B4XGE1_9GAMM|nr:VPLPA-CTERM sorting domain-containing protein [Sulfuricaulis limicola]BAV33888.1 hypothetical protein SCL_1583 [Sulfuricaulis limicola]
MNPRMKKALIASTIAVTLGATNAQAALVTNVLGPYNWYTDRGNMTLLDPTGYVWAGTNDIAIAWDGNAYNASSDYAGPGSAANLTASSTTSFLGHMWTAHDIQVFIPGTYSFDVTAGGHPNDYETGTLTAMVGSGQLGMHMLFDWNSVKNMDLFVVWAANSVFGPGIAHSANPSGCNSVYDRTIQNCLWDGPGYAGGLSSNKPAGSTIWMLSSTDGNGDGIMGIPGATGSAFQGHNFNFNANLAPVVIDPIPLPAAAWLFGSGLLGLFGVARRKKNVRHS